MMKTLTENNTFTGSVVVPQDGIDARTASSLEGGFQALANRTRYLKSALEGTESTLEGGISGLGARVDALEANTVHTHDNPGTDYTLPDNTDIRVLVVNRGIYSSGSINTDIILAGTQRDGKILTVIVGTPRALNDGESAGSVSVDINPSLAYSYQQLPPSRSGYQLGGGKPLQASFVYVGGAWFPMSANTALGVVTTG